MWQMTHVYVTQDRQASTAVPSSIQIHDNEKTGTAVTLNAYHAFYAQCA
jgi:hypothetical protein